MIKRYVLGTAIVTAIMFAGCERENATPPAPTTTTNTQAAADAKTAADAKIAAEAKAAAEAKIAADAKTAAEAKAAAEAKITADAAAKAADDTTAKANALLTQLLQYIKDNKVELAEKTLEQLDGMKGSLPTSLQEKVSAARTALQAQKAAAMFR